MTKLLLPAITFVLATATALPSSETAERAREMTSNLEKIEALIDKTVKELREAVEQLNRIAAESDKPRDAYEDYTDQLKDYKGVQEDLSDRIDHFRKIADQRFTDWEADLAKMEGEV